MPTPVTDATVAPDSRPTTSPTRKSQRSPGLVIPECEAISPILYRCSTPKLAHTTAKTTLIHSAGTSGAMKTMPKVVPSREPAAAPFSMAQASG